MLATLMLALALFPSPTVPAMNALPCSLDSILEEVPVPPDLLVSTLLSNKPERPWKAYREVELEPGEYRVKVRRDGDNYVETRTGTIFNTSSYCSSFGYATDAVLRVRSYGAELEFLSSY